MKPGAAAARRRTLAASSLPSRAARATVARGTERVEHALGNLRRRLLGADAADALPQHRGDLPPTARGTTPRASGFDYAHHWLPPDQRTARLAIYNSDDEAAFEEGGRRDAARVCTFVTPRSVVLDFGCGSGRVARYVAPTCAELWAVDVSPRMLELARERLGEATNLRFARCHDVGMPDVATASVDVVYSFLVLQHLEREDAFLAMRELRRVLRPDGVAILTFPNLLADGYLDAFVRYALTGEVTNAARARVYTPQEVERVLPAAGLTVVDIALGNDIVVTCQPDH